MSVQLDEEMTMTCALKSPIAFALAVIAAVALLVSAPSPSAADTKSPEDPDTARDGGADAQVRPRYAVAYSGYRAGQHPDRGDGAVNPSDEQILEDLRILTHNLNFGLIRLYDSGENAQTVLRLIREHQLPLRVMLGIWLSAEISNHQGCPWLDERIPDETLEKNKKENKLEVERGIKLANEYQDIVIAVSVGNEALVSWTDHKVDVDRVIKYVKKVKRSIPQKVTVADNFDWWAHSGKPLARELDFITVHSYAIWAERDIDDALGFTASNIEAVRKGLPGVELIIGEVGWATTASEFGERASEENQRRYFKEVTEWAAKLGVTLFWFEAFDEDWKGDPNNPNGAEKHFGLFTIDRKPKLVMEELYPDLK
jgi:exo-beta-1,3-glucanase (GH17 family)